MVSVWGCVAGRHAAALLSLRLLRYCYPVSGRRSWIRYDAV